MSASRKSSIKQIQQKRKALPPIELLFEKMTAGDTASLSKAITLIESTLDEHSRIAQSLLQLSLSKTSKSIRIGITGVPGVGKSTFIEAFGNHLTAVGKKVAVLAVDPSSSVTKGSILGDKTRMETLANNTNAFIRPSPAGNTLGGVARKTRESIVLCEAAGYDVILIETVGVGQSETAVHSMVDFFLLLKLAGAGDELQGIKRGIMEMADALVIHKADGDQLKMAQHAQNEFTTALHLYPPKRNGWVPQVLTASSIKKEGIEEVWQLIDKFYIKNSENGFLTKNRIAQNKAWFLQMVDDHLKTNFYQNPSFKNALQERLEQIGKNELSPAHAARALVSHFSQIKA